MADQVVEQVAEAENFEPKYRIDEEYEYYTELATNASQLWIESILRKRLPYQDDFRKSLEDGIILCELLNTLRPGCIKKINRLPSKIAGIDNLTVFLQTCSDVFSLHEKQLFQVSDLDDLSERAIPVNQLADEQGKRIRRVLSTIYFLGKAATGLYDGTPIDLSAFTGIVTACPPPASVSSGSSLPTYNRESSVNNDKMSQSRSESESPVSSAKTASTPSVARQNARADQSPSRLSDAGSFDSSSNMSSTQGAQQKEQNGGAQNSNRTSQNRTSQAHHFVKSGFSLPTGPSNLTKTAVEQMRLISESRSSGAFQAPVARQRSLAAATSTVNDDDAWQSDLDMWRMRRKQSLQSTLPAEVLQSVGLLDDGSDGSRVSDNSQLGSTKKSNKKPGLLSKLRYSIDQDSEDPIVVLEDNKRDRKDSFGSLSSSLRDKLPPIADATDSSPIEKTFQNGHGDNDNNNKNGNEQEGKEEGEEPAVTSGKSSPQMSALPASSEAPSSEKDGYKDMVFTISQSPGNLRGFGFSIKGGRDLQSPLTIDRVTAGSAADEADLRADDEILKINNESVSSYFRPTLNRLIQQCVKAGQIILTIRRYTRLPQQASVTSNEQPIASQKSLAGKQQIAENNNGGKVTSGGGGNKNNDNVDRGSGGLQRISPRVGPGPLVMEQEIKVRSPEPVAPSEIDPEWLRSQAASHKASSPGLLSKPPATSPALSSSSSSSSASNNAQQQQQQRFVMGIPRSYRGSPNQQGNNHSGSLKDETILSASAPNQEIQIAPRNSASSASTRSNGSIGSSSGAILVRGASNSNNQLPPPTSTVNDQSPSTTNGNMQNGRSPYYQQQSQIPQPWTPNNSQNTAPQQPLDPYNVNSGNNNNNNVRNGSAKKENGGVSREQAPQTPPQLPRSVSSRELCAACSQSLGAGPAMAIERLGLFYHVRCFRCSVCKISLSNGQTGVDVRVKGSRLHCQNCNSSDESGLQSSQV